MKKNDLKPMNPNTVKYIGPKTMHKFIKRKLAANN